MTDTIEKRACEAAVYVIETGATSGPQPGTSAFPNPRCIKT